MDISSILYIPTRESTTRCPISTKDGSLTAGPIEGIWSRNYSRLLVLLKPSKVFDQMGRISILGKHIGTKNEP